MEAKIGGNTVDALLTIVVAIAAINWGTREFFDTNLLVDTLELSGQTLTLTYGAIAVAGAVVIYNTYVWYSEAEGM